MAESLAFQGREELLKSLEDPTRLVKGRNGRKYRWDSEKECIVDSANRRASGGMYDPFEEEKPTFGVSVTSAIWMGLLPRKDGVLFECGKPAIRSVSPKYREKMAEVYPNLPIQF